MLLRAALLASAFSTLMLAAQPAAFSGQSFPAQGKSLAQLNLQALTEQARAALTGPHASFALPSQNTSRLDAASRMAQAFPDNASAGIRSPVSCAIPLLEAKAEDFSMRDPMPRLKGNGGTDRTQMAAPVPACRDAR